MTPTNSTHESTPEVQTRYTKEDKARELLQLHAEAREYNCLSNSHNVLDRILFRGRYFATCDEIARVNALAVTE